jgi:hypothetical protein
MRVYSLVLFLPVGAALEQLWSNIGLLGSPFCSYPVRTLAPRSCLKNIASRAQARGSTKA